MSAENIEQFELTDENESLERERQRVAEHIAPKLGAFSLMNDYFFTAFMQGNCPCMQIALRAFTQDNTIEVTRVTTQHVMTNNADGRGVRLDSFVETKSGTVYNLEVENRPGNALELRLRYYAEMLDKENLKKGEHFSKLPPIVNIVIMPKDMRGQNEPLYFIRRVYVKSMTEIGDNPQFFDDKAAFIYVNATYKNYETFVGKVIHDFVTPAEESKFIEEFGKFMDIFIRTEEGRKNMAGVMTAQAWGLGDLSKLTSEADILAAEQRGRDSMQAENDEIEAKNAELKEKLAKLELENRELKPVKAGIEEGKTTEPARFILETLAETQAARPDLYIDVQGYMKNLLAKVENLMQEPEMRQKFGLEPAEKTTEKIKSIPAPAKL